MPTAPSVEERNSRNFLRLLWFSPIVMTLLGVFFLVTNSQGPWITWLAFALALVSIVGAIRETRKTKAAALTSAAEVAAAQRSQVDAAS